MRIGHPSNRPAVSTNPPAAQRATRAGTAFASAPVLGVGGATAGDVEPGADPRGPRRASASEAVRLHAATLMSWGSGAVEIGECAGGPRFQGFLKIQSGHLLAGGAEESWLGICATGSGGTPSRSVRSTSSRAPSASRGAQDGPPRARGPRRFRVAGAGGDRSSPPFARPWARSWSAV